MVRVRQSDQETVIRVSQSESALSSNIEMHDSTDMLAAGLAKDWAVRIDGKVENLDYSSKYYAQKAKQSETLAKEYMEQTADVIARGVPIATSSTLGGIKVGQNLDITEEGVLSGKLTAGWGNISGNISNQTDLQDELESLQDEIDDVNTDLSLKAETDLSNITQGGITVIKNSILTDLNGKCDTDLSNMSASQTAKDEIILWGTPDYTNGITFTSGFTAPSIGWISINGWSNTPGTNTNVYVNDVAVSTMASGGGAVSNATQLPVNNGDVITFYYSFTMLFFPMKGVN